MQYVEVFGKQGTTFKHMLLLICSLLDDWSGNKKKNVMQFAQSWILENMDMVRLQSLPPLPALEMYTCTTGTVAACQLRSVLAMLHMTCSLLTCIPDLCVYLYTLFFFL